MAKFIFIKAYLLFDGFLFWTIQKLFAISYGINDDNDGWRRLPWNFITCTLYSPILSSDHRTIYDEIYKSMLTIMSMQKRNVKKMLWKSVAENKKLKNTQKWSK